jgi:hypothetical protein
MAAEICELQVGVRLAAAKVLECRQARAGGAVVGRQQAVLRLEAQPVRL